MFDLHEWLSLASTAGADNSLDEDAAQLLVLNDSLLDEVSGPILASVIVSAEDGHGLEAFEELARGSEPRFAAMAIFNILYILREGRSRNCEFSYNPNEPEPAQGTTISANDLPSEKYVRARVASITPRISSVFLEKVCEGDFCPDFLTYLLTVLMDLSKDCESSPEIMFSLLSVQSKQFFKEIIRVWKNDEYSSHISTTENGDADGLNLGFLVSCYLRCVCITAALLHENTSSDQVAVSPETDNEATTEIYGLDALIDLDDWFIKFAIMRIYQTSSSLTEKEYMISILHQCATRRASFGRQLLRLQFGSALLHCLKQYNETVQIPHQAISQLTCSRDIKSLWQYFHTLRLLSEQSHFGDFSDEPNSTMHRPMDVWYRSFWDSLSMLSHRSITVLIGTDFESSNDGYLLKKSVCSLILQISSIAWTMRTVQMSILSNSTQRTRTKRRFNGWVSGVQAKIASCCTARGSSWGSLSTQGDLAIVRSSLAVCESVLEAGPTLNLCPDRTNTSSNGEVFVERDTAEKFCEWCFEQSANAKMCGTCLRVWYCSSEHQRVHWRVGHKTECAFMRNTLEGCSFTFEDNGRVTGIVSVEGLEGAGRGNREIEDAEFRNIEKAQKEEMVILGFQLPGMFLEVCNEDGRSVEMRYIRRGEFMSETKEERYDSDGDERRRAVIACMKNYGDGCRIQIIGTTTTQSRQLQMHFYGYDKTHSLTVRL